MKTIVEQATIVNSILGKQKIVPNVKYRKINFCLQLPLNNNYLLYNVMTKELLCLSEQEYTEFDNPDFSEISDTLKILIEKWFLIPIDKNEIDINNQLLSFAAILNNTKVLTSFDVMTTSDCNARCAYCYELGRKRFHMTNDTAKDVADFIAKSSGGNPVKIRWFGGEPLYNSKVIDIISDKLNEAKIEFRSVIATNAYLFNDTLIQHAISNWKLTGAQITIDGTEEIYNKRKNYIEIVDNQSPFVKVLDNIQKLLENDIRVSIRLNAEEENLTDLYSLVDLLNKRFSKYEKFQVYVAPINDFENNPTKIELARKIFELEDYIDDKGLTKNSPLKNKLKPYSCMADGTTGVLITPDGNLTKCDHYTDSNFVGDIYKGVYDNANLLKYREKYSLLNDCYKCELLPNCQRLKNCVSFYEDICDPYVKEKKYRDILGSMKKSFLDKMKNT